MYLDLLGVIFINNEKISLKSNYIQFKKYINNLNPIIKSDSIELYNNLIKNKKFYVFEKYINFLLNNKFNFYNRPNFINDNNLEYYIDNINNNKKLKFSNINLR